MNDLPDEWKKEQEKKKLRKLSISLLSEIDMQITEWDADDSQQIHELRKRVFFVHTMSDRAIDLRVLDCLFKNIQPSNMDYSKIVEQDFSKWSALIGDLIDAMGEMRFRQKLVFAKKLGAIDQELFGKLESFNTLRNILGHPHTEDNRYKKYKELYSYLEALKLTVEVAKFSGEFGFKWFDELDEQLKK